MVIGAWNRKIYENTKFTQLSGSHKNINKNFDTHKAINFFKT